MRLLLVTDAWYPQINGVTTTLDQVSQQMAKVGHEVVRLSPEQFRSVPCPTYPEIRLALTSPGSIVRKVDEIRPDAIHIATEGPLGFLARRYCVARGKPFTTSFHTRFPEYIEMRFRVPAGTIYRLQRWFHNAGAAMMVTTARLREELEQRGFSTVVPWSRGVDTDLFRPRDDRGLDLPGPISLFVGRVAPEKNLEAFLQLDLPGTKLIVGDGPDREALSAKYPDVVFAGPKRGEELALHFASADVFVFPSRTDTFGLVMIEALACGVPVAALPVPGPLDVVGGTEVAVLDEDLRSAVLRALEIPREACRRFAEGFSWQACADQFIGHLRPLN